MSDRNEAPDAPWFPPDIDDWPSTARWFFLSIASLPSWREGLWAHAGDDYLRERRACRDERTIRRMRQLVLERGELARERVLRGARLPNGQRAWRSHWIYRPGPAMRARLEAVGRECAAAAQAPEPLVAVGANGHPAAPSRAPAQLPLPGNIVRRTRTVSPSNQDSFSADRSLDLKRSNLIKRPRSRTVPHPSRALSGPTSPRSSPETSPSSAPDSLATMHAIARHYASRTGRLWTTIDASVVALVAPFVENMLGTAEEKRARACAVIDLVVDHALAQTAEPPTLRYIFHPQIFWRRLERLDSGSGGTPSTPPVPPSPAPRDPEPPSSRRGKRLVVGEATAPEASPRANRHVVAPADAQACQAAHRAMRTLGFLKPLPEPDPVPSLKPDALPDVSSRSEATPLHELEGRPIAPSAPFDIASARSSDGSPSQPPPAPDSSTPLRGAPGDADRSSSLRRLQRIATGVGRWLEPPECHDPTCGQCERCEKHAPISRALFRDLRERARSATDAQLFANELSELSDRSNAERRTEQLERLEREPSPRSQPDPLPSSSSPPPSDSDLEALMHVDSLARARAGLPARYPRVA